MKQTNPKDYFTILTHLRSIVATSYTFGTKMTIKQTKKTKNISPNKTQHVTKATDYSKLVLHFPNNQPVWFHSSLHINPLSLIPLFFSYFDSNSQTLVTFALFNQMASMSFTMDSVSVLNPKLNHTLLSHSPKFHPLLKHRHTTIKLSLSLPRYALNQRKPLTLVFAAATPQHDSVSPKGSNFIHFLKWGSALFVKFNTSFIVRSMLLTNFNFHQNLYI